MRINGKILIAIVGFLIVAARSMRINGKILIAIVGFVILAAAGALGLDKLGGFALIKEFYPRNAPHQATAADVVKDVQDASHQATADVAKDVQDAAQQATAADVAKDVQTMKHE